MIEKILNKIEEYECICLYRHVNPDYDAFGSQFGMYDLIQNTFENKEGLENLGKFFYINAPALLFPYIRAYISTLTNLSGFEPINLPTLNMTRLGDDLKKNTIAA